LLGELIVTTENQGAYEVLRDGELGVMCPPEELGTAITSLLEDETRRRCLSERGLEAAHSFTLEVVLDQYETLYRRVEESVRRSTARDVAPVASPDPR
jgi:glycosyltransferase involved in cell wall biosynthesis